MVSHTFKNGGLYNFIVVTLFTINTNNYHYEFVNTSDKPHTTQFLSCDASDMIEKTGNRRGVCHLPEIETLVIQNITLHNFLRLCFPAIRRNLSQIFELSKPYDRLRLPPIVRIMTDITAEGLTLHDIGIVGDH